MGPIHFLQRSLLVLVFIAAWNHHDEHFHCHGFGIETYSSFAIRRTRTRTTKTLSLTTVRPRSLSLNAKKKRRRRKQPPGSSLAPPTPTTQQQDEGNDVTEEDEVDFEEDSAMTGKESFEVAAAAAAEAAKAFKPDGLLDTIKQQKRQEDNNEGSISPAPLELPDFRDIIESKKEREEEEQQQAALVMENQEKAKIKRSDREAFIKLLERQPFADMDDSYFEKEEYGTVSALLAEGAESFLGIPPGPLQIGHFIGALGIALMAFVEYPGFPLTNLPTPLRTCLQGGLASVFAINIVLAIFSIFKALERGQSGPLWFAKTVAVGGLAFDQLTQLPTLEQVKEMKSRKGKRAMKKNL